MQNYILSIDQGTTSSRAILFSLAGEPCFIAQQEFKQFYPDDGWVEHDPEEIWQSVIATCQEVIVKANINASQIISIGITNQRETTLVWDKNTGIPIHNAIVWQDRRTASICNNLSQDSELVSYINDKTGLILDPYFSATKIKWLLDNVEGAQQKADSGQLAFGTIDSFLIWQLTNGRSHSTDATNASRTMLFDIHQQCWDERLLKTFNIPASLLPTVLNSADEFGHTDESLFGSAVPIQGVAGDQQAALFGQTCFKPGMAKSTYGTGCFMILNTGTKPLKSVNRLLTTVAYRINGKTTYALEGSIFMAGATIQWLRDGLKLIKSASETESLAKLARTKNNVMLIPAFTGLGAPYWDPDARGAILGLTRDSGIHEIIAAGLQSVCYQTKDLQKAMENDGARPNNIRVDGGMVSNNWAMAFLSDILGVDVDRPKITETTALGAAYLAGLQAGIYKSFEDLSANWHCEKTFKPRLSKEERNEAYQNWCQAVDRVRSKK